MPQDKTPKSRRTQGPAGMQSHRQDWRTIAILALLLLAVIVILALILWPRGDTTAPIPGTPPTQTQPDTAIGGQRPTIDRGQVYGGQPRPTRPGINITVLENTGYTVGYSEDRRNPLWAAFRLFKVESPPTYPRPQRFQIDTRTTARVAHDDYTHSGYDRGHMAPNSAIATRYGKQAQLETFLMSNISPQLHVLNGEVWEDLERREVSYANAMEEVWVFTGPIFSDNPKTLKRGVQVPEAFYRILVDEQTNRSRVLAFIMPQEGLTGREVPGQFLTSVNEIERRTGLDFLWQLEDALEEGLEVQRAAAMWEEDRPVPGSSR